LKRILIVVNGCEIPVREGTTVAVALINAGVWEFRRSVMGHYRGPLCAMGTCYECRVEIDGRENVRACMVTCRENMEVRTVG
jgi:predicted molibdopterin-dependent oxidoreductase YjgC